MRSLNIQILQSGEHGNVIVSVADKGIEKTSHDVTAEQAEKLTEQILGFINYQLQTDDEFRSANCWEKHPEKLSSVVDPQPNCVINNYSGGSAGQAERNKTIDAMENIVRGIHSGGHQ